MSQLYVPDGALTTCLEGKANSEIKVTSQSSVYINNKLKATENDRFKDNFHCQKMVSGSASVCSWIGAAVGALGGPVGSFVGYFAGKFVGGLLGNRLATQTLPSLCSSLCKPSRWTVVHPKVKISKQKALLEKANLRCMMGGIIYIVLPDMNVALTHARLAQGAYTNVDFDNPENNSEIDGFKPVSAERAEEILGKDWKKLLDQDEKNGFYATLYEDKNGNMVVAYRGTDPGAGINDIKEDYMQAMGLSSDQYNASVKLAKKVQDAKNAGDIKGDVSITGHSLGGGLATIAGAATGYPTYTYNAAAVHEKTYERNGIDANNTKHIQAYVGTKDPLNGLQDNREMVLSGGVLAAPVLPVLGGAAGSAAGTVVGGSAGAIAGSTTLNPVTMGSTMVGGGFIGSQAGGMLGTAGGGVLGGVLALSGIWGNFTGGLPRQQGMQRIVVLQDCSWLQGHFIGDMITAMEQMQKRMGTGNPVKANMEITPTTLSRSEILKDWWNGYDYEGSGWGHGPRQLLAEWLGVDNKVNNLFDAGMLSMLQFGEGQISGQALEKVKNDPAMVAREQELVNLIKNDPRYGNEAFSIKDVDLVCFGGQRAPGDMWDQAKGFWKEEYRDTWKVAGNELTWMVRNTNVTSAAQVAADGTITMNHSFSDIFDLRPGGRSHAYNTITGITGTAYHDVLGGNDLLHLNAGWTSIIKP